MSAKKFEKIFIKVIQMSYSTSYPNEIYIYLYIFRSEDIKNVARRKWKTNASCIGFSIRYWCKHIYVHIFRCIYFTTFVHVYLCVNIWKQFYISIFVCIYLCVCIFLKHYSCIYVCMYICIFLCMYICICSQLPDCISYGRVCQLL